MPIETPAEACDAFRLEISELRRALETQLNDAESKVTFTPAYAINVACTIATPDTVTMTVSLTYQFRQSA